MLSLKLMGLPIECASVREGNCNQKHMTVSSATSQRCTQRKKRLEGTSGGTSLLFCCQAASALPKTCWMPA